MPINVNTAPRMNRKFFDIVNFCSLKNGKDTLLNRVKSSVPQNEPCYVPTSEKLEIQCVKILQKKFSLEAKVEMQKFLLQINQILHPKVSILRTILSTFWNGSSSCIAPLRRFRHAANFIALRP